MRTCYNPLVHGCGNPWKSEETRQEYLSLLREKREMKKKFQKRWEEIEDRLLILERRHIVHPDHPDDDNNNEGEK